MTNGEIIIKSFEESAVKYWHNLSGQQFAEVTLRGDERMRHVFTREWWDSENESVFDVLRY